MSLKTKNLYKNFSPRKPLIINENVVKSRVR